MKEKKVEREIKKNNRTHTRNTEYVIIIFFVVYKINSMQNTNKKILYFILLIENHVLELLLFYHKLY